MHIHFIIEDLSRVKMTVVSRGTAVSVIANCLSAGGIHFASGTYQTYEAKDSKGRT